MKTDTLAIKVTPQFKEELTQIAKENEITISDLGRAGLFYVGLLHKGKHKKENEKLLERALNVFDFEEKKREVNYLESLFGSSHDYDEVSDAINKEVR